MNSQAKLGQELAGILQQQPRLVSLSGSLQVSPQELQGTSPEVAVPLTGGLGQLVQPQSFCAHDLCQGYLAVAVAQLPATQWLEDVRWAPEMRESRTYASGANALMTLILVAANAGRS